MHNSTYNRSEPTKEQSNQPRRERRRTKARAVIDTTIPSPCISVCTIEGDYCQGCFRTLDEIREWIILSAEQKKAILDLIPARKQT